MTRKEADKGDIFGGPGWAPEPNFDLSGIIDPPGGWRQAQDFKRASFFNLFWESFFLHWTQRVFPYHCPR